MITTTFIIVATNVQVIQHWLWKHGRSQEDSEQDGTSSPSSKPSIVLEFMVVQWSTPFLSLASHLSSDTLKGQIQIWGETKRQLICLGLHHRGAQGKNNSARFGASNALPVGAVHSPSRKLINPGYLTELLNETFQKRQWLRDGMPGHLFPKSRHCLDGGSDPCLDLSTCNEGPQRWSFITKKW